jgi:hypothetical protein
MPHIEEEQLSAYLDRQLGAFANSQLEMHLRECESCRALFDEMREVNHLFQKAERFEPSPFLWTRIAASFESEKREHLSKGGLVASLVASVRRPGWSSGIAAAALGILMFIGIAIFKEPDINPAALAELNKVHATLAAENPDTYNPFNLGSFTDFDANPFRSVRINGRTSSAPLEGPQH